MLKTIICAITVLMLHQVLIADEPQRSPEKPAPNDPLLKELEELRKEIEELRGEIRRRSPESGPSRNAPGVSASDRGSKSGNSPRATSQSASLRQEPATAISRADSDHWSFRPLRTPTRPSVQRETWVRDDLDRFILAKLEQQNLTPNPDAERYTLLRRVAFDLTGLPPTAEQIRAFLSDPAPDDQALARVVDRYLNSPRFGERWGRHWLDVVRYADSVGRNWNAPFTYAWRYRDYVIDAFNKDKPYARFITEQIAGDLLTAEGLAAQREQLIATGFLALGAMDIIEPEGESLMMDRIDEQIDVTTRAFLGLTVACARCHDHKYEPVTMRDYYALAGIFYSTETKSGQRRGNYVADDDLILLPSTDRRTTPVPGVHSMADMTREHRSGGWREVLWTTDPNLAMAAVEGRVRDCPLRLDGNARKPGAIPARGDFHIAGMSGLRDISSDRSGRLELAGWMTSPDNPLTARVMVNRVWQHLFGRGLVETVDNFGISGTTPTHPELLDHLAMRFRETWSVKSLIRSIVLSRTYRLSSDESSVKQAADANNELYWRMNPKRLELEAVRDSMLFAAGKLSYQRPEGIQVAGRGGKGRWGETRSLLDIHSPYRTVYLPVLRSLLPEMYATFDFPNPTQVQGQREVTTVAPQSLFLMNSDFSSWIARETAQSVLHDSPDQDEERIRMIYLRLLGRLPAAEEISDATGLVQSLTGRDSEIYRWSVLIQALMISGEFRTLF